MDDPECFALHSLCSQAFSGSFSSWTAYKNTNFMSMTVHTALYNGGGGVEKTLFKLPDENLNSCIARAPSVRYPANHQQHTLGTRGFFLACDGELRFVGRRPKTRAAKSFKTRPKPEIAHEKSLAPRVPTTPCCRSKLNGKWPIKVDQKILT